MRVAYTEIIEGQARTQINIYTPEQYDAEMVRRKRAKLRRKRDAARARRMNRRREAVGGALMWMGFIALRASGGAQEIWQIIVVGFAGLALLIFGGWLAHAFYGQEKDAEWLRRMRKLGMLE